MSAFIELNERGDRIAVYFHYNPQLVARIKKEIPGRRFHGADDKAVQAGAPKHWSVPLDLDSAKLLREIFGEDLRLGDGVKAWGRDQVQKERNLGKLAEANDAELSRVAPDFAAWLRPYQRADVKMMAEANVGNFNQPGTGKTVETIAAVIEAGLIDGPHLVLAPLRSIVNVWLPELLAHQPHPVFAAEDSGERKQAIADAIAHFAAGGSGWLVVNWDVIRFFKDKSRLYSFSEGDKVIFNKVNYKVASEWMKIQFNGPDRMKALELADEAGTINVAGITIKSEAQEIMRGGKLQAPLKLRFPELLDIEWNSVTIDEAHKTGLSNASGDSTKGSQFSQAVKKLKAHKKFVLTGTPMGGKPIKLWGYLNWLEPHEYSSKWRWAEKWLVIDDNDYGKTIKPEFKEGVEDKFYQAHKRHMVRRLKREALPGLPPKVHIEVLCEMTPKQRVQYEQMSENAEVRIDGERLSATNVLAEYARLKQFANARCAINEKGEVVPTDDSGKLADLLQRLDEFGIRKTDPEPGARAIIGSESKRMVDMVTSWLRVQGIAADSLTGATKDSGPLLRRFSSDDSEPYVIVMTTQTGGISLNMERAGSVHILDETWNPDDQEQLEDRGDRGSRTTPLVCLYYRTKDTIQETIAQVTQGKAVTNANVLDVRRQVQRPASVSA